MKNLALPRIQRMQAYSAPIDGRSNYNGLLLDFNERTEPSAAAVRALKQFAQGKELRLYPEYSGLEAKIASYAGVTPAQVILTNGTDQAIDIIFRTFVDAGDEVIVPYPSFSMFDQYLQILDARIVRPLYAKDTLAYPVKEVRALLKQCPKLLVVANPNNPTGTLVTLSDISKFAKQAPNTIIFVDEAYFEFSQVTAAELIKQFPNVIVSRTFSKAFGLAGLRIGCILADSQYVTEMLKVRGPFDVNRAAYSVASAVLDDKADLRRYVSEVMDRAKPFTEQFFKQYGVRYYPSAGNFILFQPEEATTVAQTLRENGIRVRPQNKPGIEGTLRVTIGTLAQMKTFTKMYEQKILNAKPQKYAFLDRDGTLIFEPQDTYQIDSLEKLRVLDGVIEGLQALIARGYALVMVSNQDGLGTPSFPQEDFDAPHQALLKILQDAGITFAKICICPHKPEDGCVCRKPKTGLLNDFLRDAPADLSTSFVCGDRDSDAQLAKNLGVRFVSMKLNGNFYDAVKEVL